MLRFGLLYVVTFRVYITFCVNFTFNVVTNLSFASDGELKTRLVTLPPLQTKPHLGTTPSLVIDNFWFEPSCQIDPRGAGVRIKNCRWQVFNGRVSWWKCTRPFGVVLSWILENKLPLGVGCSGRIGRLMRWNETRTYWLRFGVWFVAAWPFQAEDFLPLAWGIPNWTVKPCPFSYSGNSGLKEIA